TNSTALDLVTLKALERIGAGDDLFMHRLLRNYVADSSLQIANIETAVKQKQYGAIQDYCHALKGNSLSVGALQLANTIETFNQLTASTHATLAPKVLSALNSDFSTLCTTIDAYLKRPEAALKK
ncbi:MAG: Hpt domain-containing protein, partial [Methylotenera sp.]|nr:Hpt domain-containing protein [Methylotenera sp.]